MRVVRHSLRPSRKASRHVVLAVVCVLGAMAGCAGPRKADPAHVANTFLKNPPAGRGAVDERKRLDEQECDRVRLADTLGEWTEYLAGHSDGPCAPEGRGRAAELQREAICDAARRDGGESAWRVYLGEHADGPCAAEGRAAIEAMKVRWVALPAGTFKMGAEKWNSERPVHTVAVRRFEMAKSETTIAQYRACVRAGGCREPLGTHPGCNWGLSDRDNHPANCLDWSHSQEYCTWAGGRLCSEAEWEYAARSGGRAQPFPWGHEVANCDYAVMNDGRGNGCGRDSTWPVCSKASGNSAQGVCDLAGNVWEWVQDWYHPGYHGAPTDGTAWESPGDSFRVYRGGGFVYDFAVNLQAFYRNDVAAEGSFIDFGSRCCRSFAK